PMIVIDDNRDIRSRPLEPIVHRRESVEERLPVRILLQILGDRASDVGDMRHVDRTDDLGHHVLPAATSLALNASLVMPLCWAPMSCMSRPKIPPSFARKYALPPAAMSSRTFSLRTASRCCRFNLYLAQYASWSRRNSA